MVQISEKFLLTVKKSTKQKQKNKIDEIKVQLDLKTKQSKKVINS